MEGTAASGGQGTAAPQASQGNGLSHPKEAAPAKPVSAVRGVPPPAAKGVPPEAPNVDGEGQEAKDEAAAKAEAKRRYKVKVDDQEDEVDEDELIRGYQRARSSNQRMEQAATMRKQVESLVTALRENPVQVLTKLFKPEELRPHLEGFLGEVYEEEMLPEAERKIRAYEKRLAEYEARENQEKQTVEEKRLSEAKAKAFDRYAGKFAQALQEGGLAKSPFAVKRMAHYELQARQGGYELTTKELGDLVREDMEKERLPAYEQMDGDSLISHLGEGIVQKIREADLRRVQPKVGQPGQPRAANGAFQPKPKAPPTLTIQEHREKLLREVGLLK